MFIDNWKFKKSLRKLIQIEIESIVRAAVKEAMMEIRACMKSIDNPNDLRLPYVAGENAGFRTAVNLFDRTVADFMAEWEKEGK